MKNKAEEYNSSLIDEILSSISHKEDKKIKSKMILAAKIEDAMRSKGWNKTKLLKATGQKNASVATKWFSGTHNFTHDTLFEIQEALGVDLLNINNTPEEVVISYHIVVQSIPISLYTETWNPNLGESKKQGQTLSSNTPMIIAAA